MSRGARSGEAESQIREPPSQMVVLPDPPEPKRYRSRLFLAVGAIAGIGVAGTILLTGSMEDGQRLRRATTGELEASGQPALEFAAPSDGPEPALERPPEPLDAATTSVPRPTVPSPSREPAASRRLGDGSDRPAGALDDLGLARRAVAEQIRAFDRRLTEFESGAVGCRELADAYGALDRAFVHFSTLLVRAGQPPGETDARLFEIADQESAAFDRSGCPRPS